MRVIESAVLSLCVISSMVLAEPPVGVGYPSSRSSEHEYQELSGEQRSLPSEYGLPAASSRASLRGHSPTARVSFTQRFPPRQASVQARTTVNTEQTQYNAPSLDYGTPVVARNLNQKTPRDSYSKGSLSRNSVSSTYGASSRSSGAPSRQASYSQHSSVAPALSHDVSTYDAPSARGLVSQYGAPARTGLNTDAVASSYASARASSRSSPSSSYLPPTRSAMPSQQYGVPDDNQQYEAARARALEELLKQAPANYEFSYQIEDSEGGADFGHEETRLEDRADGSYFVVLPDGTKQTVQYSADEDGFKPRISVEPLGGYDANAQEIGPY